MSSPEQAVVVGAAGSFGSAIVAELIKKGQHVVGVGRHTSAVAELCAAHGPMFTPVAADIGKDASVETIQAAILKPVSMVVHAAGVPLAGGIKAAPTSALSCRRART